MRLHKQRQRKTGEGRQYGEYENRRDRSEEYWRIFGTVPGGVSAEEVLRRAGDATDREKIAVKAVRTDR